MKFYIKKHFSPFNTYPGNFIQETVIKQWNDNVTDLNQ